MRTPKIQLMFGGKYNFAPYTGKLSTYCCYCTLQCPKVYRNLLAISNPNSSGIVLDFTTEPPQVCKHSIFNFILPIINSITCFNFSCGKVIHFSSCRFDRLWVAQRPASFIKVYRLDLKYSARICTFGISVPVAIRLLAIVVS